MIASAVPKPTPAFAAVEEDHLPLQESESQLMVISNRTVAPGLGAL